MSGIAGVWTGSAAEAPSTVDLMVSAIKHRGSQTRVEYVHTRKSAVALGCLWHEGTTGEIARSSNTITAITGSFYQMRTGRNARHVLLRLGQQAGGSDLRAVVAESGGFAGLVALAGKIYGFRDVNGLKPLYYARKRNVAAFASERKALWRLGLQDARPVPPGCIVRIGQNGVVKRQVLHFHKPRERKMTLERASAKLHLLLIASMRKITAHARGVCVAFSGGLDSAVTAAFAKRAGVELRAISVGLRGSPEISTVEKFAHQLGLNVSVEIFESESIEEYVRRVLWLIEEPNLMKLSVAIPLHWAAMVAARSGFQVMLCGQGSDELYGGYAKYANTLRLSGRRALINQLYRSVVESSQINYERDDQATSPFQVELRTPFADPDLIRFSLAIPSEFKVKDGGDTTRKWVLRDVAKAAGVPEEIVWRRKKAIQHGTGVEKAIIKLAKSRGYRPDEYLSKTFDEVRKLESMP